MTNETEIAGGANDHQPADGEQHAGEANLQTESPDTTATTDVQT